MSRWIWELNRARDEQPLTDERLRVLELTLIGHCASSGGSSGSTLVQKHELWALLQEVRLARKGIDNQE